MSVLLIAALTLGQLQYHHRHPGFFDARDMRDSPNGADHFRRAHVILRRAASIAPLSAPNTTIIRPTDFGADPTGVKISSAAFKLAVDALLSLARPDRKDFLGLYDLGGATMDLSGGVYRVSRPVAFPAGYANFKVMRGSLVASDAFDGGFMLSVGGGPAGCAAPPTTGLKAGNCNSNIDISHVTLDGRRKAAGGLLVNHTMDVNIGPAMMVVGYTNEGISLAGSGAAFVSHAWLGAESPGSPTPRTNATGTAIVLDHGQHDAMIEDVIIFSGQHGVRSANGANRLQGVHAWNLAGSQGGIGIDIGAAWPHGVSGGRVQNCYLDYAPLVVRNPGNLLVTANLFLGSSAIVLRAASAKFAVRNLIITNNEHHTNNRANSSFIVDERGGTFASVTDVVVENNQVDATDAKVRQASTRATKSAPLHAGDSSALIYYNDSILFPSVPLDTASLRCWLYGPHATALSASLKYTHAILVHLAEAVPASVGEGEVMVTCEVDQSTRSAASGPAH